MSVSAFALAARVAPLSRRELFLWLTAALCADAGLQVIFQVFAHGALSEALNVQGFVLLAWVSAFVCLAQSGPGRASSADGAAAFILAIAGCAPGELVWVALTGASALVALRAADRWQRAAATVLAAITVQRLWGRAIFAVLGPDLIRLDAILTGWTFPEALYGTVRHDNIISLTPNHGIEILAGCSSFNNISLAILCWVAVTKLQRPHWRPADAIVGGVAIVCTFAANLARLHVMALSPADYLYWHHGPGEQIFGIGVSTVVLILCIFGSAAVARPP